jgi:O-antigen ligase
MTALLTAVIYLAGAGVFVLWRRNRRLGVVGVMAVTCTLLSTLVVLRLGSYSALSALGKDSTLTGRTGLWHLVLKLVKERPLLGWGYRATWQSSDPMTTWIDSNVGFKVPSSHNAFLEITLQLGWVGLVLMSLFIFAALRRGARCFAMGCNPLGWFSMMFVVGTLMAGLTTETLGQGQVIEWVVLNSLVFSCGVRCWTASASKSSNWNVIESQSVLT